MGFVDGLAAFISWLPTQPWAFAVPYVAVVFADWGSGSLVAKLDGTFQKERVFDWLQTTVGWKQSLAIAGTVAGAYFLQGQHTAFLAIVPLVTVNGAAFLIVLKDVEEKLKVLFLAPKVAPSK